MDLEGHVAVVTGGASGIGRATAGFFAREGAKVEALRRRHERLEQAVLETAA